MSWSVQHVQRWLSSFVPLPDLASRFRQRSVDGPALLLLNQVPPSPPLSSTSAPCLRRCLCAPRGWYSTLLCATSG
eukprot:1036379-Rhodomonas_salina.1